MLTIKHKMVATLTLRESLQWYIGGMMYFHNQSAQGLVDNLAQIAKGIEIV